MIYHISIMTCILLAASYCSYAWLKCIKQKRWQARSVSLTSSQWKEIHPLPAMAKIWLEVNGLLPWLVWSAVCRQGMDKKVSPFVTTKVHLWRRYHCWSCEPHHFSSLLAMQSWKRSRCPTMKIGVTLEDGILDITVSQEVLPLSTLMLLERSLWDSVSCQWYFGVMLGSSVLFYLGVCWGSLVYHNSQKYQKETMASRCLATSAQRSKLVKLLASRHQAIQRGTAR